MQVFGHLVFGHLGGLKLASLSLAGLVALKNFFYLFMAVLGLHFCKWAFSSCREQGLLSSGERASHCSDFSLQSMGSRDEIQ